MKRFSLLAILSLAAVAGSLAFGFAGQKSGTKADCCACTVCRCADCNGVTCGCNPCECEGCACAR